jgi:hypothetical protein
MKTNSKSTEKSTRLTSSRKFKHYFHADEDFREDKDWGKYPVNAETSMNTMQAQPKAS